MAQAGLLVEYSFVEHTLHIAANGYKEDRPLAGRGVRVGELVLRIPTERFWVDGVPRQLFRNAMRGVLPEKILAEPGGGCGERLACGDES
jgi:hypothetical protein